MELKTKIIYSVIGGLCISLLTGLFQTPYYAILGANLWGLPFPWLTQAVLGPDVAAPFNIIWVSVFFNVVIWSVVLFLGIELFEIGKKKEHKTAEHKTVEHKKK
ncbi:Uncharacterised protein [Candidatus Tiddalikarchaeum anstoanum]|nr:Uncharacterised protein [Candidatus Tiddalikarchaeum anstoanum]